MSVCVHVHPCVYVCVTLASVLLQAVQQDILGRVHTGQRIQGSAGASDQPEPQVGVVAAPHATRGGNVPANVLLTVFLGVRALAERVLQDSSEQLRVQCSRVEQAFSQRCVELTEAKLQLEMKLTQVDPVKDQQVFMAAAGFLWF